MLKIPRILYCDDLKNLITYYLIIRSNLMINFKLNIIVSLNQLYMKYKYLMIYR